MKKSAEKLIKFQYRNQRKGRFPLNHPEDIMKKNSQPLILQGEPEKKMKKKRKDGLKRQADIMEIALGMFAENGYNATSVDDIIARAGIAKGTFYLHFKGKLDILDMIIDKNLSRLHEAVQNLDVSEPIPIDEIKRMYMGVVEFLLREKEFVLFLKIVLRDIAGIDHKLYQRINDFYNQFAMLLAAYHKKGKKTGTIRQDLDSVITAYCVLGAIKDFMFRFFVLEEKFDIIYAMSTMSDLFLQGMLV